MIIGQYAKSLDGTKPGYLDDDTVPKDSRCPTFCALAVYIKNERWDGVPFILKAGKGVYNLSGAQNLMELTILQLSMSKRPRFASNSRMSQAAYLRTFPAMNSSFVSSPMRVFTSR